MSEKTLAQIARENADAVNRQKKLDEEAKEKAEQEAQTQRAEAARQRLQALRQKGRETMSDAPYEVCVNAVKNAAASGLTEVYVTLFRFRDSESLLSDEYQMACGAADAVVERLRNDDGLTVNLIRRVSGVYNANYGSPLDLRSYQKVQFVQAAHELPRFCEAKDPCGTYDRIDNKGIIEVRIAF
jgi:hypothetical protein